MAEKDFFFKFYAGEFLLDEKVDLLPDAAQLLLVKMWCLCCLHGYAPADPALLAKRAKMDLACVQLHLQSVLQFFCKVDADRLVSPRLEAEMAKAGRLSKTRAEVAKARWNKEKRDDAPAPGPASDDAIASAIGDAKSMQLESELKKETTPYSPPQAGAGKAAKGSRVAKKAAKLQGLPEDARPYFEFSWETFPTDYKNAEGKSRNLRMDEVKVIKLWSAILGGAFAGMLRGGEPATAEELACAAQFYILAPHPKVREGYASEIGVFYSISEKVDSKNLWAEAVNKLRDLRKAGRIEPARPWDGDPPMRSPRPHAQATPPPLPLPDPEPQPATA